MVSSFQIIEEMEAYNIGELADVARRLARRADIELEEGVSEIRTAVPGPIYVDRVEIKHTPEN